MEESFERRPLLDRELLRSLQARTDLDSTLRLSLQVAAFAGCAAAIVVFADRPLIAAPLALALGGITASLFAPFHECIHQTAFRSRSANRAAAWIAGIPFCVAPSVYRAFHFAHHRHTQDPERDPEIMGDPAALSPWPHNSAQWLRVWSGAIYLPLRALTFKLAVTPPSKAEDPLQARESLVVAGCWIALAIAAALGVPGAAWILLGMALSHFFHGTWLPTEHTGLPHEGTIFARTRTMHPSRFVKWWIWNMNYHAEHHAWPAIPWHRLPEAHRHVAAHVEQQGGAYWRLHADAFRKRGAA
jgi:fatty acid desaturase